MKIIFLTLIMINFLFSIGFNPLYVTVDNKKNKNFIFTVSNFTKDPVPVNISVLELLSNNDKKENRIETTKVTFYPSQFILNPKENKNIRLRYMGSSLPKTEEVYRVIAKELNININDEVNSSKSTEVKARIVTKFTYEALLFVKEPNAKEKFETKFKKTSKGIELTVINHGNASAIPQFTAYDFIVTIEGKEYKLLEDDLKGSQIKRVLAGKTNVFYLNNISSISFNKIDNIRLEKK